MMANIEKEILEYVRQHPGCERGTFDMIKHSDAAEEADRMVSDGKLDRWYSGTVPAYYIPGTYTPPHLIADTDDTQEGAIPLAAELHRDGTIHIYVKEKDSGLSVGLLEDGTLVVKVDESMRTMIAGKVK
jgi:hypothetical protein